MNYPLISEYIETVKSAEDNFGELTNLRPVFGEDGQPVMTSGNFAVVFKMKDEATGKLYALKCFTKEQEGRAEAYHQIAEELKDVDSSYLVSIRYLDKELFVDTDQTDETEFPVLLMDWVEGKTLDKYLRENLDDKYALEMLAYRFSQLAQWLIPQPFAHGDLKPDNILVREDGTLVLVDYDGMYVPAMKGQKARELGSPDFRHPLRTENDFDEHIDDFPLTTILLSLKAIYNDSQLLEKYGALDRLLLSKKDYQKISQSNVIRNIFPSDDNELNRLCSIYTLLLSDSRITGLPPQIYACHISIDCIKHFFELGEKYRRGIDVELDGLLSVRYYRIAAEFGYAKAQYKLGVCYFCGYGVSVDYTKALYWFQKAYEQGDIEALYNIGCIYSKMDIAKAESIYIDVVEKAKAIIERQESSTEALGVLGTCLFYGKGIKKDVKKAFEYLKQAAEKGNDNAQARVGCCFYYGRGVDINKEEAVKWFYLSANKGNPIGEKLLGECYIKAEGVAENKRLGISLLQRAFNQGELSSQRLLGNCYFKGDGVKKDFTISFSLKALERFCQNTSFGIYE